MKLIILSDNGRPYTKVSMSCLSAVMICLTVLGLLYFTSYYINVVGVKIKNIPITSYENTVLNKFDNLVRKATRLEAQVARLNELSRHLANKNKVDIQNYLLSKDPAMGGMDFYSNNEMNGSVSSSIISQKTLLKSIDDLEIELDLQEQRFETMIKIQSSTTPNKGNHSAKSASKKSLSRVSKAKQTFTIPVSTGYVSSSFGKRRDPINGHPRHHNGIDIAAKHGSKIHAISSGFVVFVGRKSGYGNVIDIRHDKSLLSRYAHLDKMHVQKGDVVRNGEMIATMGQTGRATGSHLHLEILKNNKPINPKKYIDTALIK